MNVQEKESEGFGLKNCDMFLGNFIYEKATSFLTTAEFAYVHNRSISFICSAISLRVSGT